MSDNESLLTGDEAFILAKQYADTHGGGGGGALTKDIVTNVEVGGVPTGTKYSKGTLLETIIDNMLVKYIAPGINFSIVPSASLVLYGTEITEVTMTAIITKKSNPIKKVEFKVNGSVVETITEDVEEGGIFSFVYNPDSAIVDTTAFSVVVADESKGNSSSKIITFCNATYYGTVGADVTTPTAEDITALRKIAVNDMAFTYENINMSYGKILYAYDKTYGSLTSIKDANNIEYINSYSKSRVTIDGVDYFVYLLKDAAGVNKFTQIYK